MHGRLLSLTYGLRVTVLMSDDNPRTDVLPDDVLGLRAVPGILGADTCQLFVTPADSCRTCVRVCVFVRTAEGTNRIWGTARRR